MIDELIDFAVGVNQALRKFFGVRGGVANAFNSVDFRHIFQKHRKVCDFTIRCQTSIGINILSQKRHFFNALSGKLCHFD